jgi:hypothetical protein
MPVVPSSPCPRPRPASGVQGPVQASSVHACPSTRPLSNVRCGRLSLQVSDVRVRCPACASSVRGFRCPLCPIGVRSWRAVGHAAAWLDGRDRRSRPPCPRPACRLPESESGDRGWRRTAGPAEASAWTCVVVGGDWAVARSTSWRPRRPDAREDRPSVASQGAQPGSDYAPWSSREAQGRVAWSLRAFPAGLRLALAAVVRPQHAASAARIKLATL